MRIVQERSDSELLRAAERGEAAAVEALLARYWELAYRVALRLTGDPASAEDAAQQGFVKVLGKADQLDPARGFRSWFLTIVANEARMIDRARSRRTRHEARAPEPRPPRGGDRVELRDAVRAQLAQLPEGLRAAIQLHYLDGLTHAEAATVLGCPKNTVTSRIRRGLQRLRGGALAPALAAGTVSLPAALEAADDTQAPPPPDASLLIERALAAGAAPAAVATGLGPIAALVFAALLATAAVGTVFFAPRSEASRDSAPVVDEPVESAREARSEEAPDPGGRLARDPSPSEGVAERDPAARAVGAELASRTELAVPAPVAARGRLTWDGEPLANATVHLAMTGSSDPAEDAALAEPFSCRWEEASLDRALTETLAETSLRHGISPRARALVEAEQVSVSLRLVRIPRHSLLRLIVAAHEELGFAVRDGRVLVALASELGASSATAETDVGGWFTLEGLSPSSRWQLWVTSGDGQAQLLDGSLDGVTLRRARRLELELERPTSELRVDVLPVTVRGIVTAAASGEPVAEAQVASLFPDEGDLALILHTVSGEDGRFELDAAWDARFHVRAAGYAVRAFSVPARLTSEVQVRLERGASLRGVVRDAAGRPAVGATVVATIGQPGGGPSWAWASRWDDLERGAKTDAEGRFEIPVGAGDRPVDVRAFATREPWDSTSVWGVRADQGSLVLTLQAPVVLSGRVVDEDGNPVERAGVVVLPSQERWTRFSAWRRPFPIDRASLPFSADLRSRAVRPGGVDEGHVALTGPEGRFRLSEAPPGKVRLLVRARGFAEAQVSTAAPGSVRVTLRRGRRFKGRVQSDLGQPVARALVRAFPAGTLRDLELPRAKGLPARLAGRPAEALRFGVAAWERRDDLARLDRGLPPAIAACRTGDTGAFLLGPLADERCDLLVTPTALATAHVAPEPVVFHGVGPDAVLELPSPAASGTLRLRVRASEGDGRVVPGVGLLLLDANGDWLAPPAVDGWGTISAGERTTIGVPAGALTAILFAPDREPVVRRCRVEGGASADLGEVVLRRGGRALSGELISPSDRRADQDYPVLVVVRDASGMIVHVQVVLEDRFELEGLPTGALRAEAHSWPTWDLSAMPRILHRPVEGEVLRLDLSRAR